MTENDSGEDATREAELIVAALSDDQVRRYVGSLDRRAAEAKVARERAEAGSVRPADVRLTPPLLAECDEAEQVAAQTLGRGWAIWRDVSGTTLVVAGAVFLGAGVLALLVGLVSGSLSYGFSMMRGWVWRFDGVGAVTGILIALSALGLVAAMVMAMIIGFTDAARARRLRPALLDWAVERPGQLGRGLPGLRGSGSEGEMGRRILWAVGILGAIVAAFMVPVSAIAFLTSLLPPWDGEWMLTAAALLAGSLLLAYGIYRLARHLLGRDTGEEEAFAWRWWKVPAGTTRQRSEE
ncbi:hypothetical protein [Parenemella sanctibonifatiensis]|uniref:Uncharacterized protein n=1 Tax=Parenemella sanctibonifatiensis TaxID=2016505 RepID=A0A255E4D2_9ACTN|nr:hypothetical protein [Parenemella sanctibonifatiensis]OYN86356.1 hypothetical protein CGZ92_08320 [Parenemella sanctibonifatiensis]